MKFKQEQEEAHKKRDQLQKEIIGKQDELNKIEKEKKIYLNIYSN